MTVNIAYGKCLSYSDVNDSCRYVNGDAWCAANDYGNPYAYSDNCLRQKNHNIATTPLPVRIKQDMNYLKARKNLLRDGWQVVKVHTTPNGTPICDSDNQDCKYIEINACSGTGMGFCKMTFYDGYGIHLEVITQGGSPPDAVINGWNYTKEPDINVE